MTNPIVKRILELYVPKTQGEKEFFALHKPVFVNNDPNSNIDSTFKGKTKKDTSIKVNKTTSSDYDKQGEEDDQVAPSYTENSGKNNREPMQKIDSEGNKNPRIDTKIAVAKNVFEEALGLTEAKKDWEISGDVKNLTGIKEGPIVVVKLKNGQKKIGLVRRQNQLAADKKHGDYSKTFLVKHLPTGLHHVLYTAAGTPRIRAYGHKNHDLTKKLQAYLEENLNYTYDLSNGILIGEAFENDGDHDSDDDEVSFDVPTFIKALEWAREDANKDSNLHIFTENAVKLNKTVTMEDFDKLTEGTKGASEPVDESVEWESEKHKIEHDRMGNVTLTHKSSGKNVYIQGDDATEFRRRMNRMKTNKVPDHMIDHDLSGYHEIMENKEPVDESIEFDKNRLPIPKLHKIWMSHKEWFTKQKAKNPGQSAYDYIHDFYSPDEHTKLKVYHQKNPDKLNEEYEDLSEEIKVGSRVHLGFGAKGGAGYKGKVTKIDGNEVHVEQHPEDAKHNKFGARTWKGQLKHCTLDEAKHWIAGAIKHPGKLHAELGIPQDKKIPEKTLDSAAKKKGVVGKEARLAKTLEKMHEDLYTLPVYEQIELNIDSGKSFDIVFENGDITTVTNEVAKSILENTEIDQEKLSESLKSFQSLVEFPSTSNMKAAIDKFGFKLHNSSEHGIDTYKHPEMNHSIVLTVDPNNNSEKYADIHDLENDKRYSAYSGPELHSKLAILHGIQEGTLVEEPGLRLIGTHEEGSKKAKVYRNHYDNEYQVKLYNNNKHHEPSDYFTDDEDDAHGTAKLMIKAKK